MYEEHCGGHRLKMPALNRFPVRPQLEMFWGVQLKNEQ